MPARRAVALLVSLVSLVLLATTLAPPPVDAAPTFVRQQGVDRYGTAAAVSSVAYPSGAKVVFVANGDTFPDALAGGPAAAALGAPVLLVRRTGLPNSTAGELDRLDPENIVVLGGTSAVSQELLTSIAKYASVGISRIEGADRYATAAKISETVFLPPTEKVYVATGQSFADALSGGAGIAGTTGGPLLLVLRDSIPPATAAELARLTPSQITVLGGPSAVSATVVQQLQQYASNPVLRRGGGDRYATSLAVSSTFPTAPKVYLATGEAFPDALAASAVAGANDSPVILVPKTCIPANVDLELTRLNPTQVVVLGGTAALGPGIESRQVC